MQNMLIIHQVVLHIQKQANLATVLHIYKKQEDPGSWIAHLRPGSREFIFKNKSNVIMASSTSSHNICEIILNLGQWFRWGCHSKIFLFLALVAILFSGMELFVQF